MQIFIKDKNNRKCEALKVSFEDTGDSRYVDFAYVCAVTYAKVIFHSQHFFSVYLCISSLCRKWLTWNNGYLEVIFYALDVFCIIFASAKIKNRHLQGRRVVCFGYVHVLPELQKSSKQ